MYDLSIAGYNSEIIRTQSYNRTSSRDLQIFPNDHLDIRLMDHILFEFASIQLRDGGKINLTKHHVWGRYHEEPSSKSPFIVRSSQ